LHAAYYFLAATGLQLHSLINDVELEPLRALKRITDHIQPTQVQRGGNRLPAAQPD